MARTSSSSIDPKFWDRLRRTLHAHMDAAGLNQKELAADLSIDPTTFNNFLTGESKTLGGLPVALACTITDVLCNGITIGKVRGSRRPKLKTTSTTSEQLVLNFDAAFELKRKSKSPTLVLRKSAARQDAVRLTIKRLK